MTTSDSSADDSARWQKSFASKANNRAWALAEKPSRTADEDEEMLQAAHASAQAFLRAKLWHESARVDRSVLPSAGRMISDQTGLFVPAETKENMERRYQPDL